MDTPYKITLISLEPSSDTASAQVVQELIQSMGATKNEVLFWLDNLPHTLTSNASREQALEIHHTFTKLGADVKIEPDPNKPPPSEPSQPQSTSKQASKILEKEEALKKERSSSIKASSSTTYKPPNSLSITSSKPKKGTISPFPQKGVWLSWFFIAVIILIFSSTLYFAYQWLSIYIKPNTENAQKLIERGEYQLAKQALSHLIREQPPNNPYAADSYLWRGIARIHRIRNIGQKRGWKGHLVSQGWDQNLDSLPNYYKGKEGQLALQDFSLAIKKNPKDPRGYRWLGALYQQRGEYAKAQIAFKKALQLTPNNTELLNFLATTYIDQKNYSQAEHFFKKGLQQTPRDPLTLKNLGSLHQYYTKNTQKAFHYYRRYLDLHTQADFDRPVIRQEITQILWNQYFAYPFHKNRSHLKFSSFEPHRIQLQEELKKQPNAEAYRKLGRLFLQRGMYQEGSIQLLQALRLDPKRHDISNELFRLQGSVGRFSEARGTLQRAISHKTPIPDMYFALGLLHKYYTEDIDQAIHFLQKYIKLPRALHVEVAKMELKELLNYKKFANK